MLVNLKAALAARQTKQIDLALQLGVDPTLLSRIVNQRCNAEAQLRSKIAAALNADEDWLFQTAANIPEPRPDEAIEFAEASAL